MRITASVSRSILGSGTFSTRTSLVPYQRNALMISPRINSCCDQPQAGRDVWLLAAFHSLVAFFLAVRAVAAAFSRAFSSAFAGWLFLRLILFHGLLLLRFEGERARAPTEPASWSC